MLMSPLGLTKRDTDGDVANGPYMPVGSSVNSRSNPSFCHWLTLINRTSQGFLDVAINSYSMMGGWDT
jgi:hypothetical protein